MHLTMRLLLLMHQGRRLANSLGLHPASTKLVPQPMFGSREGTFQTDYAFLCFREAAGRDRVPLELAVTCGLNSKDVVTLQCFEMLFLFPPGIYAGVHGRMQKKVAL